MTIQDALNGCLEKATTNLLLDNFGCETQLGDEKRQRRQLSLRGVASKVKSLKPKVVSEEERLFSELLIRNEEDVRFLSSGMSLEEPKPSSCRFDIEVQVPNVINLGRSMHILRNGFRRFDALTDYGIHRLRPSCTRGLECQLWACSIVGGGGSSARVVSICQPAATKHHSGIAGGY